MTTSPVKYLVMALAVAAVVVVGYTLLNTPDTRTTGQKVGDAIDTLPEQGLGEAAEELEDRTPAERLSDTVDDAAEDMSEDNGTSN